MIELISNDINVGIARSDAEGHYGFLVTQAGTYELRPSMLGASFAQDVTVILQDGDLITQDLQVGSHQLEVAFDPALGDRDLARVSLFQLDAGVRIPVGEHEVTGPNAAVFMQLVDGDYVVEAISGARRGVTPNGATQRRWPRGIDTGRTVRHRRHRPG